MKPNPRPHLEPVLIALLASCCAVCAAQPPQRLTLHDAIQQALAANLNGRLASARIDEAEGTRLRRLSAAVLPQVNAQTYANLQNRDLRAFGISLPGMPEVVGPFSNYDFRIYAQQNLYDPVGRHALKSSERAVDADKLDYRDARDMIVRLIAALYLNAESASARSSAASSRVNDSDALYKLARDKHDAGTATGVDVLRAQVQLANDKQALLVAQNQYKQSLLALQRAMGSTPGEPLELAESLHFTALKPDKEDSLIQSALAARADYLSLASQRQSLVEQQLSNKARSYPKLSLNGNYGAIGRSIGGVQGTGLIQGQIDFTLYNHDREGEAQEVASRIRSIDEQIADLRRGIAEDVREALLNLDSAAEQVAVAQEGEQLARRELELSQDRFKEGTANNVEVVTAQDELARAEENTILAISSHMDATFALARSLGDTEMNMDRFERNQ
jgi:outer membrane protein TolC